MARTRVDVWNATDAEGDWPAVLEAYERAIATMRGLDPPNGPPTDPIGWQFQAAIHGRADDNGDADTSNPFWCNCQHGSWFFLPWHRMYLAAFEKIIQFHLEDESWALPYWYAIDPDSPKKAALPPAFLDLTLNDNNLQTDERSQIAKAGRPVLRRHRSRGGGGDGAADAASVQVRHAQRRRDLRRWRARRPELQRRRARAAREHAARRGAHAGRQRLRRVRPASGLRLDGVVLHRRRSTRSSGATTPTSTGSGRSGSAPTPPT